jgi:hypothetical protein
MKVPSRCPSCGGTLQVRELHCPGCDTKVEGVFDSCPVCALPEEYRALLDLFLKARGNAKRVERELGVSYPTVRARLEQLWQHLDVARAPVAASPVEPPPRPVERAAVEILQELETGKLSVTRAAALLRTRGVVVAPGPTEGVG